MESYDDVQKPLREIIESLFKREKIKYNNINCENEDVKIKFEFLKLICGVNDENDYFQIDNIINFTPINCLIQQKALTFLSNIATYSIEELILRYDTISLSFYELKREERFTEYLKNKKFRAIPFFVMLGFISYLNLKKDQSAEIIKLSKKDYIKEIIDKYIDEKRKSLFNIILYYNKTVLHLYDEETSTKIGKNNDLLILELKESLQRYICFNELYDQGEIVNFVNCLYNAITNEAKSIYLQQGNELEIINNVIKLIFDEILEDFSYKYYYEKSHLNRLYDLIADIINNSSVESMEENYAKFIVKYCRFYKQGNKNIVFSFINGLNPKNFTDTFKCLKLENNNNDYYKNIENLICLISSGKNNKKNLSLQSNNLNNNQEIISDNNKNEIISLNDNNSQENNNDELHGSYNKNIENNEIINNDDKISMENELSLINNVSDTNQQENENNNQLKKEFEEMKKIMKKMSDEFNNLNRKYEQIKEENKNLKEEIKQIQNENKRINEESRKFRENSINSHIEIKSELFKIKHDMKQINYRDISKPIINNYIKKFENKLNDKKLLKNKKEKAMYIIKLLKGQESSYYNKIVNKYYDSNFESHISKIFKEYGKKYIIGMSYDKNDIINKILNDYCNIILDEKNQENVDKIEKLFDVRNIIEELAKSKMLNF